MGIRNLTMAENGMDISPIIEKLQELGDLELAALLCLIAGEHCIIRAATEDLYHLERKLRLVLRRHATVKHMS